MPPQLTCQVCGSSNRRAYAERTGMRLFECLDCRLVWLDPMPDPAAIEALYDDAYESATASYFSKVERKLARSRGRVRQIVRVMPDSPVGKRFLDVGANGGFMTEAAREAGFLAVGVEPDSTAIVYACEHYPKNQFVRGLLETADLGTTRFDVAYCSEVIEHSSDCNRFMAKLSEVIRPGGLLYLTTPDISHWRRPKALENWDAFCPPAHCLYFSPANLQMLLERHGFSVVRRRFAWKPGIKVIARRAA